MKKILIILLPCLFLFGCKDKCPSDVEAWTMAQYIVKNNLKSPSSADFPYKGTVITGDVKKEDLKICSFFVGGPVDSQNSFGAIIRSHYAMDLKYVMSSKKWTHKDLIIE